MQPGCTIELLSIHARHLGQFNGCSSACVWLGALLGTDFSVCCPPGRGAVSGPPQTGNYVSKTLHDLQRFLQLRVNPNAEGFCRVFDGDVRLHALALYAFSPPRIPARDGNAQDIAAD